MRCLFVLMCRWWVCRKMYKIYIRNNKIRPWEKGMHISGVNCSGKGIIRGWLLVNLRKKGGGGREIQSRFFVLHLWAYIYVNIYNNISHLLIPISKTCLLSCRVKYMVWLFGSESLRVSSKQIVSNLESMDFATYHWSYHLVSKAVTIATSSLHSTVWLSKKWLLTIAFQNI